MIAFLKTYGLEDDFKVSLLTTTLLLTSQISLWLEHLTSGIYGLEGVGLKGAVS